MKEVILIKDGELILKGLNRRNFEDKLSRNIKNALKPLGSVEITRAQSVVQLKPIDDMDIGEAERRLKNVFGIAAFSRSCIVEKDMDVILNTVCGYLEERLEDASTFKVNAKRSDKKFPLKSPEICALVGERILDTFSHLTVDVHNPDVIVTIEIRDFGAYIHADPISGAGGLPVGTGGRAAVLISGGIDSPVAAWMMAKRGLALHAIHFATPPYTSERAEQKVISLLEKVARYAGAIKLNVVPFTELQECIRDGCPEEFFTIIMRRYMMKISEIIAKRCFCDALITGESVGQVASQTIKALACTDMAVNMPVFRPLIGMDKHEIIAISRVIDTFDISILPYEDCCTVFTPKHPCTKPVPEKIIAAEQRLEENYDIEGLINQAIENVKILDIE